MNHENLERYLVLSDMHFGSEETTINEDSVLNGIIEEIVKDGSWKQIIFTGDLLDLNLSTFTQSIEGDKGFRKFLELINSQKSLDSLAEDYIYLPGNHDYKIWDMLSTEVVCTDILASGKPMGTTIPTPFMHNSWPNGTAFVAGIFPAGSSRVTVTYPDHLIKGNEWEMVLTHGHYLSSIQTRGNDLCEELKNPIDLDEEVKEIFKETAQYQIVANMLTFTKKTRKLSNDLFGPANIKNKVQKFFDRLAVSLLKPIFRTEKIRGKRISDKHLKNMEYYLRDFRSYSRLPDYFLFGHTHDQDRSSNEIIKKESILGGKVIEVFNAGAFFERRKVKATFIEIEIKNGGKPEVKPMCINKHGNAEELSWPD
jgi:predicted phosphodiesterase